MRCVDLNREHEARINKIRDQWLAEVSACTNCAAKNPHISIEYMHEWHHLECNVPS